jgi:hypothetical protein
MTFIFSHVYPNFSKTNAKKNYFSTNFVARTLRVSCTKFIFSPTVTIYFKVLIGSFNIQMHSPTFGASYFAFVPS